jgi:TonB family protein
MRLHHNLGAAVLVATFLVLQLVGAGVTARAQDPDSTSNQTTEHGIDLYRQGDAARAVKVLDAVVKKHPNDSEAWYYLGLAYYGEGYIGNARPAFEELIKLRPNSADAHAKLAFALVLGNEPQRAMVVAQRALELGDQSAEAHYAIAEASLRLGNHYPTTNTAAPLPTGAPGPGTTEFSKAIEEAEATLRINPSFALALITKSFAHRNLQQYPEAISSLERFLALSPDDIDAATWREQLEEWRAGATKSPSENPTAETQVFAGKEVTQKVRVLSKPEPQYTEAARKAGVSGTIVLRTVFSASGEVKHIVVIRALGYGLTSKAINAARKIGFTPATKDGKPVSMYMQLEYNFNLY